MKNEDDMIKWLNNLKNDIGQPQHSQLWHYVEILDVIARYLENTERTGITTNMATSLHEGIRCEALCTNPMKSDRGCDGGCQYDTELLKRIDGVMKKVIVDSPTDRTGEWISNHDGS